MGANLHVRTLEFALQAKLEYKFTFHSKVLDKITDLYCFVHAAKLECLLFGTYSFSINYGFYSCVSPEKF